MRRLNLLRSLCLGAFLLAPEAVAQTQTPNIATGPRGSLTHIVGDGIIKLLGGTTDEDKAKAAQGGSGGSKTSATGSGSTGSGSGGAAGTGTTPASSKTGGTGGTTTTTSGTGAAKPNTGGSGGGDSAGSLIPTTPNPQDKAPVLGKNLQFGVYTTQEMDAAVKGEEQFLNHAQPTQRVAARLLPITVLILVRSGSGIRRSSDLKGKRVATGYTEDKTAALLVESLLLGEDLDTSDVKPVPVATVQAGLQAFVDGKVDAAIWVLGGESLTSLNAKVAAADAAAKAKKSKKTRGRRTRHTRRTSPTTRTRQTARKVGAPQPTVRGAKGGTATAKTGSTTSSNPTVAASIRVVPLTNSTVANARRGSVFPMTYLFELQPSKQAIGVASPTWVMAFDIVLVTASTVTDDLVYNTVKAIHGGRDALIKQSGLFAGLNLARMAQQFPGQIYHPGAIKYYKEVKIWPGN